SSLVGWNTEFLSGRGQVPNCEFPRRGAALDLAPATGTGQAPAVRTEDHTSGKHPVQVASEDFPPRIRVPDFNLHRLGSALGPPSCSGRGQSSGIRTEGQT